MADRLATKSGGLVSLEVSHDAMIHTAFTPQQWRPASCYSKLDG